MAVIRVKAKLTPLTKQARVALGGRRSITIDVFPFRIGRESRQTAVWPLTLIDRRKAEPQDVNSLYLADKGAKLQISREHCVLEVDGEGHLCLVERGSACGTEVNGEHLAHSVNRFRVRLSASNEIAFGSPGSTYRYLLEVFTS